MKEIKHEYENFDICVVGFNGDDPFRASFGTRKTGPGVKEKDVAIVTLTKGDAKALYDFLKKVLK
jgi:hypothetical protein